jgi:iron-sulfur cluster assembly protein
MIEITSTAVAEITRMQSLGAVDAKLYLTLGSGSCEQYHYQISLQSTTASNDSVVAVGEIMVAIDAQYHQYLANIKIDFSQDLMGGGFRFQNPQAAKVCGCGNAFSV